MTSEYLPDGVVLHLQVYKPIQELTRDVIIIQYSNDMSRLRCLGTRLLILCVCVCVCSHPWPRAPDISSPPMCVCVCECVNGDHRREYTNQCGVPWARTQRVHSERYHRQFWPRDCREVIATWSGCQFAPARVDVCAVFAIRTFSRQLDHRMFFIPHNIILSLTHRICDLCQSKS